MTARVLLVDDDVELRSMLRDYLIWEGFDVKDVGEGADAVERALGGHCDILVLDVMLPDTDGFAILSRIRRESSLPVLMLSARGDGHDRVAGLELGADDYVPKPCSPRELCGRIRAILKRASGPATTADTQISAGSVTLWPSRRRVERDGQPLPLTSTEFNIVELLVRHAGRPVSKAHISEVALQRKLTRFDRAVDVHVSSIRQKVGLLADGRSPIQTVVKRGYQLLDEGTGSPVVDTGPPPASEGGERRSPDTADQRAADTPAARLRSAEFHANLRTSHASALLADLRNALQLGQMSVHYQPTVDIVTGQVVKAEALMRWDHPAHGFVPPAEFIPIAENAGLIDPLGDFVFEQAARVANTLRLELRGRGRDPLRISVNRSARQFTAPDGADRWIRHLRDQALDGSALSVEITESILLDDQTIVANQLRQLRATGMTVELDDFGTGYSALSYLKKFKIDFLKIDRSFVQDIVSDANDRAIVEAIIAMAKSLGISLIAEGVETHDQARILSAVGCDLAQGFLYARPMPEQQFIAFVAGDSAARQTAKGA